MIFADREEAARLLAQRLRAYYRNKNPLVLGVPRGAVPMAKIIADGLGGELDVVLVRKLGHPTQPELAIGAIDESGRVFFSDYAYEIDEGYLEAEKTRQLEIIRQRRALHTPDRPPIDPHNRVVIIVDDGIATGSTMTSALRAVRAKGPKKLLAAVAVASVQAARALGKEADAMVCLNVPIEFFAVGQFFRNFSQVTDEDVIAILRQSEHKARAVGEAAV
jgi:predicted phosphoribosyltransferase